MRVASDHAGKRDGGEIAILFGGVPDLMPSKDSTYFAFTQRLCICQTFSTRWSRIQISTLVD